MISVFMHKGQDWVNIVEVYIYTGTLVFHLSVDVEVIRLQSLHPCQIKI